MHLMARCFDLSPTLAEVRDLVAWCSGRHGRLLCTLDPFRNNVLSFTKACESFRLQD